LGTLLVMTGTAQAQSAAPPPRRINIHSTPPAAKVPRTHHVHDGFYVRMSVGLGSLAGTFDDERPENYDLDLDGLALAFDALVGGSPSPGITVGGALLTNAAPSASASRAGLDNGDRGVGVALIGPFVDGFFDPKRGLHLGGMVGLASIDVEDDTSRDDLRRTGGAGGAAWIGYDFWVASQWSTGVQFRVAGALTREKDGDVDASAVTTTLMFTTLYH
jgi:hypothetical protein